MPPAIRFTEQQYQSLTGALVQDLAVAIKQFCATDFNHDVYALSVIFHWQSPDPWLCVENEVSSAKRCKEFVKRWGHQRDIGVQSLRFAECDFGYIADGFLSAITSSLYQRYLDHDSEVGGRDDPEEIDYHRARFEQLMFETVARVAPLYAGVRQTADFIGYAMRENTDENHTLRLLKSQIPVERFGRIFPEYKT